MVALQNVVIDDGPQLAPGLQLCSRPDHRDPANQELTIDYAAVRRANDIESRAAVIEPALCQAIELLWLQAQHLGGKYKLRPSLLLFNNVIN